MSSHRLAKLDFDGTELFGYSIAGEETVVTVPTLDVCFDIGKAPDQALSINNVLLTHGHMDHAAGIAYYCSQRDFREMAPGRVFLPERLVGPVEDLLDCWGRIDGSRPPGRIVPLQPDEEFELRRNLFLFAFATRHSAGSLGYTIIERRQKLKKEYLELPGPEIAKLRKSGVPITYTLNMPLVTYLGDTAGGDFEQLPCVRDSKILIAECTFFDPDHHDRARAGRHYHIDNLSRVLEGMNNQHIVLTHLTRRTEMAAVRQAIKERFSPQLAARTNVLMDRPRRRDRQRPEAR